jgi:hypothetical protein
VSAALRPEELVLLRTVRRADEEEGGLALADLDEEESAMLAKLASAGLVETIHDDDGGAWARITWRGVDALRDHAAS